MLRIATVDCPLSRTMREMGHEVQALDLKPGVHDLPAEFERRGFNPDIFIQQETLGPRKILSGLERLPCTKVFWSIDTHLNTWWHGIYGRFFDLVFTTQDHWIERLQAHGLPHVMWLPWYGGQYPFLEHAGRDCPVGFVGRLTEQRQVRRWMVEFLRERFPFVLQQTVPAQDLPAAYSRIRLVPNEAILGELNFRVFEAASSGCAVFTPQTNAGLDKLFDIGREIVPYEHALDLAEHLAFYTKHPEKAEELGRLARKRILEEHLPRHRAEKIIFAASSIGPSDSTATHRDWIALLFHLSESNMLAVDPRLLEKGLESDAANPDSAARLVRFLAGQNDAGRLTGVLTAALAGNHFTGDAAFDLAASMAGVRIGHFDLAKAFWYRRLESSGRSWSQPESPGHLLVSWAEELSRDGLFCRAGFPFDPERHLPASALECLFLALHMEGPGSSLDRRISRLLVDMEGSDHLRLGVLSDLSLRNKQDWRAAFELGLLNIRCFRLREGIEELGHAEMLAQEQGRRKFFSRLLKARDTTGLISKSLEQAGMFSQ